ncbi:peptidoglycan recognition protein family protein [Streptomyces abikoensis]|uniref:peptidoglycan recognition protein family protein n=1 Tax=Streptomyces abikoensis TaxID=97398 RepID=UPI0033DA2738
MRGNLVPPAASLCAAALTLSFLAAPAAATPSVAIPPHPALPRAAAPPRVPGATHSLRLVPLGPGHRAAPGHGRVRGPQGLPAREVPPFSLVGIVWDDATTELRGRAQVRTRPLGGRSWSEWRDVQTHDDDRPDLDSPESRAGTLRGSTAPLWVGASDAVQVRVNPEPAAGGRLAEGTALPSGMRVELVDPGHDPAPARPRAARGLSAPPPAPGPSDEEAASSAANFPLAPLGATEIPAVGRPESAKDVEATHVDGTNVAEGHPISDGHGAADPEAEPTDRPQQGAPDSGADNGDGEGSADVSDPDADSDLDAGRYVGPRPRIVTRAGWGADESIREKGFVYNKTVHAAFVHHTASGNGYGCGQSPSVIRGIYRYHVVSSGWRDIGYNFLVDKCGTVYEGRAGGVAKPVRGAHTLGFNTNSMGIAVLGTFGRSDPSSAALTAVATLSAWKLGLYGVNPAGTATLVSGGGNLFKKGSSVRLRAISGHRDGYATECPGDQLYNRLGTARSTASRLQGR